MQDIALVYQFRKIIIRHKCIGYNIHVIRQSACLVIIPITGDNFAALFNCTPVDRASDSNGPDLKLFILVCCDQNSFFCRMVHQGSTDDDFLLLQNSSGVQGSPTVMQHVVSVESSSLLLHIIKT